MTNTRLEACEGIALQDEGDDLAGPAVDYVQSRSLGNDFAKMNDEALRTRTHHGDAVLTAIGRVLGKTPRRL